jgi:predicted site-specific integrase-resolvase
MKLSAWAKEEGVPYQTAWTWFKNGILPVPAIQLPTGTILVHPPKPNKIGEVVLYARVSSSDQKSDLDRQVARLTTHATGIGLVVARVVSEIGSAMNGRRSKLLKVLLDTTVGTIVVEHRDRLMRFGFDYLEASLKASGRCLVIVDETETNDDLVRDMTEVLTSFCARLYGKRSARNKAKRALEAAAT